MLRVQLAVKRAIDIIGALIFLPLSMVVAPVLILLVQLSVPGWPVVITQERIGRGSRPFKLIKLRTLKCGTELLPYGTVEPGQTTRDLAPGICLIRRLALDELPQLWHVLVGQMSFFPAFGFSVEPIATFGWNVLGTTRTVSRPPDRTTTTDCFFFPPGINNF